ncbi:MAG: recombinase family protein [Sphingomonadales bacterium]|nr:MAG: recombinase family protein [Sphingomonadales bacterium]
MARKDFVITGTRAAIYVRYSSHQSNPLSTADQTALCQAYAQKHGYDAVEIWSDEEKDGKSEAHRPAFQHLASGVREKRFDVVIVEQLERLGRNLGHLASFFDRCNAKKIAILCVNGDRVNRFHVLLKGFQAQEENLDKADKVDRGHRAAVLRGKPIGGIPYGYVREWKVVEPGQPPVAERVIDPIAAEVVRRIYEEYASGLGTTEIVRRLNAEGILGPRGKHWNPGHLLGHSATKQGLLRRPIYIGQVRYGVTHNHRDIDTGLRWVEVSTDEIAESFNPDYRILEDSLYYAVQDRISALAKRPAARSRTNKYLLTSKLTCCKCGYNYVVVDRHMAGCRGNTMLKVCDNRTRVDMLEAEDRILAYLEGPLLETSAVDLFIKSYAEAARRWRADMRVKGVSTSARITKLEKTVERLVVKLADGALSASASDVVVAALNKATDELSVLRQQSQSLNGADRPLPSPAQLRDRLQALVANLRSALRSDGAPAVAAREAIRRLLHKITVVPASDNPAKGSRNATLHVEGKIADLLSASEATSTIMISLGGYYPTRQYYDPSFEFFIKVGLGTPSGTAFPIALQNIRNALENAPGRVSGKDLLKVARKGDSSLRVQAAMSRLTTAIAWLEKRGLVKVHLRSGCDHRVGAEYEFLRPVTAGEELRSPVHDVKNCDIIPTC